MKKLPSKQDVRRQIESQVDDYLAKGGTIKTIPQGISGHENQQGLHRPIHQLFDQPKQTHTHIPEVLAALDERKKKKSNIKKPSVKKPRPKEKIIYDDFGEPLRRIWVEE